MNFDCGGDGGPLALLREKEGELRTGKAMLDSMGGIAADLRTELDATGKQNKEKLEKTKMEVSALRAELERRRLLGLTTELDAAKKQANELQAEVLEMGRSLGLLGLLGPSGEGKKNEEIGGLRVDDIKLDNRGSCSDDRAAGSPVGLKFPSFKEDSVSPGQMLISMVDRDGRPGLQCKIPKDNPTSLKRVFEMYASKMGTQTKFLRFKHKGRPLFFSSVKNRSAADLGIEHNDEIEAWHVETAKEHLGPSEKPAAKPATKHKSHPNAPKRNKSGRPTKEGSPCKHAYEEVDAEKKWKQEHSRALSRVFEEVAPKFKDVRQKLNSLNLERTKPKTKSKKAGNVAPDAAPVDNPSAEGLGGKAGRTHFPIQVGEVDNLYKSAKRSSKGRGRRSRKKKMGRRDGELTVDLHGLTAAAARAKLDECLSRWIEVAMHGSYPFVIGVDVVCGGGDQILSEAVEDWIRSNDRVANAPKKRG